MRDRTIDGYRALAALGVVFAHAVSYRFANVQAFHLAQRLATPLAETSVQLFFVISGYIITTLLLKEREKTRQISIPAFYVRRVCRIIPPLATVLLTVSALRLADGGSLLMASTFTCNIGDCHWFVAHTWSLSVEEQFYLLWPMLLVAIKPRPSTLVAAIGADLLTFLIAPLNWHSNYISFACIGMGALYAMRPVTLPNSSVTWIATTAVMLLGPLYVPARLIEVAEPFLIVYLLFATPPWMKHILAVRPIQVIGLSSYSIYLWQQLFLARPDLYPFATFPMWLLPAVVAASVIFVEQPFIRLGRLLSSAIARKQEGRRVAECTALPAP